MKIPQEYIGIFMTILVGIVIGIPVIMVMGSLKGCDLGFSDDSSSPVSEEVPRKYCKYGGCTNYPSEFWEAGTGYCSAHAQQLRDEQKLIDKIKNQGY